MTHPIPQPQPEEKPATRPAPHEEAAAEASSPSPIQQSAIFAGSTLALGSLVDLFAHLGPTGLLLSGLLSYVAWRHGPELYAYLRGNSPPDTGPALGSPSNGNAEGEGVKQPRRSLFERTRTVISQAHSFQWLDSFGNKGNEHSREELCQGLSAITRYLTAPPPQERTRLRPDGQYGTGTVLADLAGFASVTRVKARLHLPPDKFQQRPESQGGAASTTVQPSPLAQKACRAAWSSPRIHPAGKKKSPVGITREGIVYELSFSNLPPQTFTACDVVDLYLHRGAFEPALADEDAELDPDR